MPTGLFVKRAGRVISGLIHGANSDAFTALDAIDSPVILNEDVENIDNTVGVLEMQGFIEVQTDAEGHKSIRLTPSGVAMASTLK
jgi:hypothetical protein